MTYVVIERSLAGGKRHDITLYDGDNVAHARLTEHQNTASWCKVKREVKESVTIVIIIHR